VLKGFHIYFIANGINKAIPFLLLPIITRYLDPSEYGIWSIYQVLIAIVVPLIGIGNANVINRDFYTKSKRDLSQTIGSLFILLCIMLFSLSGVVLGGSNFVDNFFGIPLNWLSVLPVLAFCNVIILYNLTVLRNANKPKTYAAYEISRTILFISIALLLIVLFHYGWEALAIGILLSNIIISLFSFFYLSKSGYLVFYFDNLKFKEILVISLPLLPHAMSSIVIAFSDRLFIDAMMGKEAVGLYTIGYTFGMVIILFTDAFNKVWSPWMYRQLASINERKKRNIVKLSYIYMSGFLLLALLLTVMSQYLLEFMVPSSFWEGRKVIIWVAMGFAVQGMYFLVFPYFIHLGETKLIGVLTLTAASINLVLNYFLINLNGISGAAQATLAAYIFLFLGVWFVSAKHYPMPWALKKEISC